MMKKETHTGFKLLVYLLLLVFSLIALFGVLIQTDYGKEKIKKFVLYSLEKSANGFTFEKLEGTLPFQYTLKNVSLSIDQKRIQIGVLDFKIAPLPLFKKQLYFKYLTATDITSTPKEKAPVPPKTGHSRLPFSIYVKKLNLEKLSVDSLILNCTGRIKIDKHFRRDFIDITFFREGFKNSSLRLTSIGITKTNSFKSKIELKSDTLRVFSPYLAMDQDFSINSSLTFYGERSSLLAILQSESGEQKSGIKGYFLTTLTKEKMEPIYVSSSFILMPNLSLELFNSSVKNSFIKSRGNLIFGPNLSFQKSTFFFNLISTYPNIEGGAHGEIDIIPTNIDIKIRSENLGINKVIQLTNVDANLNIGLDGKNVKGNLNLATTIAKENMQIRALFEASSLKELLIKEWSLTSPSVKFSGSLLVNKDYLFTGNLNYAIQDFTYLRSLLPLVPENGKLVGVALFEVVNGLQNIKVNGDLSNFRFQNITGENVHIESLLKSPFSYTNIISSLQLKRGYFHKISVDSLDLKLTPEYFKIDLLGEWKDSCRLVSEGIWRINDETLSISINRLEGDFFKENFSIEKPIKISTNSKLFFIKDLNIRGKSSSLTCFCKLTPLKSLIKLKMDQFPLDFLSLNPWDMDFFGKASSSIVIKETNKTTTGYATLKINDLGVTTYAEKFPLKSKGSIKALIKNGRLDISGDIRVQKEENLLINGSLPIKLDCFPFKWAILEEGDSSIAVTANGRIEHLLDFMDVDLHRLEGGVNGSLSLTGPLNHPKVEGKIDLQGALYENYLTGTYFSNLNATILANNSSLVLEKFSAKDEEAGTISVNGKLDLKAKELFPYELNIKLKNFLTLQKDWISAKSSGDLRVVGNQKGVLTSGSLEVVSADLLIPEKLPAKVPILSYTFVNKSLLKEAPKEPFLFPLNLDISLKASSHINISGRGLTSEWEGSLKIGGAYPNVKITGGLNLLEGAYSFANRHFTLTGGEFSFENELPIVNLTGETKIKDKIIFANLKGPLLKPKLTLKSKPVLPASAIFCLLIFGSDISEISSVQANVLTSTLATLANTHLQEKTMKSLGMDRTSVVTSPQKSIEDFDKNAGQVGQYVTKNNTVYVSRGTEQGGADQSIEVSLTHGFMLQIEREEDLEQGKFILKWSKNY